MVIDEDGTQLGVMPPLRGREIAQEKGLDLVEVAPNARPPVCRIMDYGRFRYEQRKRHKKPHQVQTKMIKLRPKTDPHDLETKLRHARRFLEGGDRVRFVVRMRGRERSVTERWKVLLSELMTKLDDVGIVAGRPQLEGGAVCATVEPRKAPQKVEDEKPPQTARPPQAPVRTPAAVVVSGPAAVVVSGPAAVAAPAPAAVAAPAPAAAAAPAPAAVAAPAPTAESAPAPTAEKDQATAQ